MDIKEGFETAAKELKQFTESEIQFYEGQGQSVDRTSHTNHSYKMYVLGKLQNLSDRLDALETKGATNVTRKKTTTKKARSTSKKGKRKSSRQLELEL